MKSKIHIVKSKSGFNSYVMECGIHSSKTVWMVSEDWRVVTCKNCLKNSPIGWFMRFIYYIVWGPLNERTQR